MKFDRKFGQKSTIHQNTGWSVFVNLYQPLASLFTVGFGLFFAIVFRYIKHAFTNRNSQSLETPLSTKV